MKKYKIKKCHSSPVSLAFDSVTNHIMNKVHVLDYGAIIWDPHTQSDIRKLERVQRQVARFITGDYKCRNDGCVSDMLTRLKLPYYRTIAVEID